MTEFGARPTEDIKAIKDIIQKRIDRNYHRRGMSVRGIVNKVREVFQPSTGSREPISYAPLNRPQNK